MTTETKPETNPEALREARIHEMLTSSVENGYDITKWTADDIVADLLAFADLNEDEGEAEIRPHVLTWKMKRSGATT